MKFIGGFELYGFQHTTSPAGCGETVATKVCKTASKGKRNDP